MSPEKKRLNAQFDLYSLLRTKQFDLYVCERPMIGSQSTSLVDHADFNNYFMVPCMFTLVCRRLSTIKIYLSYFIYVAQLTPLAL